MWKRIKYARVHTFTIGVIYARKYTFAQKGHFPRRHYWSFSHKNTFELKVTFARMVILHESKKRQKKIKMKFIKKKQKIN